MSKNLHTFAVLASQPARDALDIIRAHPEITDPATGLKHIAAFERGDVVESSTGPVDELNAIIEDALHGDNCRSVAFFRSVMDGWNNTPLDLVELVRHHWPDLEHMWGTFIATGIAAASPDHTDWLQLPPLNDDLIQCMFSHLSHGENAERAFLSALHDWLDFVRSTHCLGLITARSLGPSLNDSDYSID